MIIKNCFDSHLHWQGIGSFKCRLNLSEVNKISDIKKLPLQNKNFRSNWLMGHGWTKKIFSSEELINPKKYLDNIYPDKPVYFTSHDIHGVWLNSKAIDLLGINSGKWKDKYKTYISLNKGELTGLFYDLAKDSIDQKLPTYSDVQVKEHLLTAQEQILKAGITHIRDLTCSEQQLTQAIKLYEDKKIHIVADLFFKLNSYADLSQHIKKILKYKKVGIEHLKIKGVKVFVDGALGSGGALLTSCYIDKTNGFKLFTNTELEDVIKACFSNNLEVAFHTIGDQSSLDVCKILVKLKNIGISGHVHLEHVQILTDECISYISDLNISCHMQPQHWCSDKNWLDKKLPKDILKNIFRWADLESKNIKLFFGSDAPVENLNIGNLLKCLKESSANNIPPLKNNITKYITYPSSSPISAETHLSESLTVEKVVVNNKVVFKS